MCDIYLKCMQTRVCHNYKYQSTALHATNKLPQRCINQYILLCRRNRTVTYYTARNTFSLPNHSQLVTFYSRSYLRIKVVLDNQGHTIESRSCLRIKVTLKNLRNSGCDVPLHRKSELLPRQPQQTYKLIDFIE